MRKKRKLSKIEMLDREIAKWQRAQERSLVMQRKAARLLQRSAVELARLNKKRVKLVVWPSGKPVESGEIEPGSTLEIEVGTGKVVNVEPPKPDEDIPTFLDRTGKDKDAAARAEIEAEQAEKKKRKAERRISKLKIGQEIRQAELTGQRRKMPLTGKDALAAIASDK